MPQINTNLSDTHQPTDIFQDMNILYYRQIAANLQVSFHRVPLDKMSVWRNQLISYSIVNELIVQM